RRIRVYTPWRPSIRPPIRVGNSLALRSLGVTLDGILRMVAPLGLIGRALNGSVPRGGAWRDDPDACVGIRSSSAPRAGSASSRGRTAATVAGWPRRGVRRALRTARRRRAQAGTWPLG